VKFSIITPSFNQGRYIRDCIESVRAQEGVDWEHIVVDACSTDETLSVLQAFPHLQWTSEPDGGMSDGINKGFTRAAGEWVMWLNADDYLLPGALAKVADFAGQHPEADVIYGGWNFVDADRRHQKSMKVFPFDLGMLIYYGCYIGSTACFLRRSTTVGQGFLLNPEFRYVMDTEYYARLGTRGKRFRYLPHVLAGFRVHGNNTSMVNTRDNTMTSILARQKQLAESAAVRRAYGRRPSGGNPAWDGIHDSTLWFAYRLKKILLKIWHRSYSTQRPIPPSA